MAVEWLPSVIGAAGGVIGTAMTNSAQSAATKKQMEFQRYMSNTAYQRAAKDLEKAGLNRVLALGSPATTPAGSQPNLHDFGSSLTSGMQAGANSALQSAKAKSATAQGKLDQSMYKFYKSLPEYGKQLVGAYNLSRKTGVDPAIVLGTKIANKVKEPVMKGLNWLSNLRAGNPSKKSEGRTIRLGEQLSDIKERERKEAYQKRLENARKALKK